MFYYYFSFYSSCLVAEDWLWRQRRYRACRLYCRCYELQNKSRIEITSNENLYVSLILLLLFLSDENTRTAERAYIYMRAYIYINIYIYTYKYV